MLFESSQGVNIKININIFSLLIKLINPTCCFWSLRDHRGTRTRTWLIIKRTDRWVLWMFEKFDFSLKSEEVVEASTSDWTPASSDRLQLVWWVRTQTGFCLLTHTHTHTRWHSFHCFILIIHLIQLQLTFHLKIWVKVNRIRIRKSFIAKYNFTHTRNLLWTKTQFYT